MNIHIYCTSFQSSYFIYIFNHHMIGLLFPVDDEGHNNDQSASQDTKCTRYHKGQVIV